MHHWKKGQQTTLCSYVFAFGWMTNATSDGDNVRKRVGAKGFPLGYSWHPRPADCGETKTLVTDGEFLRRQTEH
jgi:hypothetical protein